MFGQMVMMMEVARVVALTDHPLLLKIAKRILFLLVAEYHHENLSDDVPDDEHGYPAEKPLDAAYRNTRRWLFGFAGYKRGQRKDNIVPNPANVTKRHKYLREFFANRELPPSERLREVYTDESYIHQYYHRRKDSIYNANDDQDMQVGKDRHKGKRFCFIAAIQGPDPRVAHGQALAVEQMAGLVPNSEWWFSPQQPKQNQGDYHKVFNGANYLDWWENK